MIFAAHRGNTEVYELFSYENPKGKHKFIFPTQTAAGTVACSGVWGRGIRI